MKPSHGLTPYNVPGHYSPKLHSLALIKRGKRNTFSMEEKPISDIQYPPGIRFHPSDEELITYYLQRKVKSLPLPANVIADIELYSYNPWDLPRKALFGEDEWYFFTPRDRKYPNGGRPNRTAASGYWKATGTDKPILSSSGSRSIGVKKALVFYKGKPPTGLKMDWIMTEYRLPETSRPLRSKGSMRLDDWVICRVRQKGNMSKNAQEDDQNSGEYLDHLPKVNELPSVCIGDSRDMLADYFLSSECHLTASLLIGHDAGVLNIPRTIFQNNKRGANCSRAICEERPGKLNTQATFSLFQSFSNSVLGQPKEESSYTTMNDQKDGAPQSGQMVATMGTISYRQHVSEGNKFKPSYMSNAYVNLQELDMPALSENFLH